MASKSGCHGVRPDAVRFLKTFFSSGYSAELQNECCREGVDLNDACHVDFFANNSVRAYGNVGRGQFKANPDIAGFGVRA